MNCGCRSMACERAGGDSGGGTRAGCDEEVGFGETLDEESDKGP